MKKQQGSAEGFNGYRMIEAERLRQIKEEGWTAAHDDAHKDGELAIAAACYASPVPIRAQVFVPCGCRSVGECGHVFGPTEWRDPWPWDAAWDKRPKEPASNEQRVRALVKAGALIAAEIDRLQRESFRAAYHGRPS